MDRRLLNIAILLAVTIVLIALLTGCPPPVSYNSNGEFLRTQIITKFDDLYGVNFSSDQLPAIKLIYTLPNGTNKTAVFQLDGYDPRKQIGYKLVIDRDKANWDNMIKKGSAEAPDLDDYKIIKQKAMSYEFPVLFLWIQNYKKGIDSLPEFDKELSEFIDSDIINNWAKNIRSGS